MRRLTQAGFVEVLRYLRDSAPDLDGLPYRAWLLGGPLVERLLYAAYLDTCAGRAPPSSFNLASLTFIPKSAPLNATACLAEPAKYGPLSLSSSVHKLLANEAQCVSAVLSSQRGFVKHRSMALNVLEVQATIECATLVGGREAGVALLDIAAAFPSVEWAWIWASLHTTGVAEWNDVGFAIVVHRLLCLCYVWWRRSHMVVHLDLSRHQAGLPGNRFGVGFVI